MYCIYSILMLNESKTLICSICTSIGCNLLSDKWKKHRNQNELNWNNYRLKEVKEKPCGIDCQTTFVSLAVPPLWISGGICQEWPLITERRLEQCILEAEHDYPFIYSKMEIQVTDPECKCKAKHGQSDERPKLGKKRVSVSQHLKNDWIYFHANVYSANHTNLLHLSHTNMVKTAFWIIEKLLIPWDFLSGYWVWEFVLYFLISYDVLEKC